MPRVSVIIPAYNVEAYIERAVSSVLDQSFADLEAVVVDDGSTDRTAEAVRGLGSRVRLIVQSNKGPSAARNAGILSAGGSLIALLDGDDYWPPDRLDKMVDFLDSHPNFGWATSDAIAVEGDTPTSRSILGSASHGWGFKADDQAYWITQHNFVLIHSVVRRELFDRHGMFDEGLRRAEEWDLWIRFLLNSESVGFVEDAVAFHRYRVGSLSSDAKAMLHGEAKVLRKAWTSFPSHPGLRGRLAYAEAKSALLDRDYGRARSKFLASFRDRKLNPKMRRRAVIGALAPKAWGRRQNSLLSSRQPGTS